MNGTLLTVLTRGGTTNRKLLSILLKIVENELTETQQTTFIAYYLQRKSITQIANERKVNKSTVCRNLQRAEKKVLLFTKYLTI